MVARIIRALRNHSFDLVRSNTPDGITMNRVRSLLRFFALLAAFALVSACMQQTNEQLVDLAKKSRAEGKNAAAIIHLKNALQRRPQDAEARYLLGLSYNENRQGSLAESELRRASELGLIEGGRVMAQLGRALLLQEAFKKVLDEIKPAPAFEDSAQASIQTSRGLAHLSLNQIEEARQSFEQSLSLQPEYADALLGKARLAAAEKNFDEAARQIERAIASTPKSEDAWLLKGDFARMRGDQAGALAAYTNVLELNPNHIPARENVASLEISAGNFDAARKHIDALRKVSGNSPMANHLQAVVEFNQKNYPAARDAVQQVLKVAPDYLPSALLAGAIHYQLGAQAQAQEQLGRVVERVPGNLYARKLLVSSLAKSGQLQRAIEMLQPGLSQAPEDGELLALAGELYMHTNEFSTAADYLEKAARRDPQSAGVRTKLGMSRLGAGDTERAFGDLESAVRLDSTNYQADVMLVLSHLRRAEYAEASKALQSLEKKQPENPLTYNLKASIFIGQKDIPSARKSLDHALKLQPDYVPAAVNLALLDVEDKDPKTARRRLEVILEKEANNGEALLALANLGTRIGATRKEETDWLERARKTMPGSAQPQLMMARSYMRIGDTKKALDAVQQAEASFPDNSQVLELLGSLQAGIGRKEQALTTYRKLVTLQPNSPVVLYRLAATQAVNGEQAGAASTLKKALALKPDFIEARATLADLEIRAGHYPEAMAMARQIQKDAAASPLGFSVEGDVLMAQKKYPQAAALYETAFRLGENGVLVIKLHQAYTLSGKPGEADARLARWLKNVPEDSNVQLYGGDEALRRGKYQEAIVHYEWLQQKQPDNVTVLNNLAWAYQQVKDKRARDTAEVAYKLKPEDVYTVDTLGWILVGEGDTKRGIELLQTAVASAPGSLEIRYHLAQAWLKAGEKSKARSELEQLVAPGAAFTHRDEARKLLSQLPD